MKTSTIIISAITAFIIGMGSSIITAIVEAKGAMPSAASWLVALFGAAVIAAKDNRALMKLPTVDDTQSPPSATRRFGLLILALFLGLFLTTGASCPKTTPATKAFNSIYSVEKAGTAAFNGYLAAVIDGKIPTNDLPRVSQKFNAFQASVLVALDGVQFRTNALAPPSLETEMQDLVNLINSIKR